MQLALRLFFCFAALSPSLAQALPTPTPVAVAAVKRILCLGDSLTEGYGVRREDAFPTVLGTLLQEQGLQVAMVNAGVSGSTTASGLSRLRWHLKGAPPDLLILSLGANDGLRGIAPATTKENLSAIIQAARAGGIAKILLTGMSMPPNMGPDYTRRYAAVFPDLAQSLGVPLMPFLLKDVGGEAKLNQPDGIHPNTAGHKIMAQNLLPQVLSLLKGP